MQISSGGGALRLQSDKKIIHDFFFTFMTGFHESEDTNYVRCLSRSFLVYNIFLDVFMYAFLKLSLN